MTIEDNDNGDTQDGEKTNFEALPVVGGFELDDEDRSAKKEALILLEGDRLRLLSLRPFIGSLCMSLKLVPVVDARCVTACTDGRSVFFNAHWACSMAEEQRMAVLAHEIWHCGLLHFVREKGRIDNHRLWNYAIDHEVNTLLRSDGFKLPDDCVIYEDHVGKSAEQIYEMLLSGFLKPNGELMDEHLSSEPADYDGTGCSDSKESDDDGGGGPGGEHGILWDGSGDSLRVKVDSDFRPFRDDEVFKEWKKKMASAIQQASGRGHEIGKYGWAIDVLQPKIDWRELLRQFVTPLFGGRRRWLPPSRRHVHSGLYLQSRRDEVLRLVIAIDTSGSTTGEMVVDFVTEVFGIAESFGNYEITVIQCDMSVQNVDTISTHRPPELSGGFDLFGGGGTDLRPPFDYVRDNVDCSNIAMLYMTDGYGPAPTNEPVFPVIWVMPEGDSIIPAKWGDTIYIPR